jgi:hypothetical protein
VPRLLTAVVCVAALAALAGCGESDQEQAREVVQDYVDARGADDYGRICELYSDDFKEELNVDDCEAFVREQTSGGEGNGQEELNIVDVRVRDDRAIAEIDVVRGEQGPSRIGLVLTRDGDDWKISGLQ